MPDNRPRIACRGCMCLGQPVLRPQVIAINETDPLSARLLDASIASLSKIAVRHLHRAELHAPVTLDEAEGIPRRLIENGKSFNNEGPPLSKRFRTHNTRKSRARQLAFCMQVDDCGYVDGRHAQASMFSQEMMEPPRTI